MTASDTPDLVLTGYRLSVYTRSAAMALDEAGVGYAYVECDPFDPADALRLMAEHPFGRVPVLREGAFRLWETAAILDYVVARFDARQMVPDEAQAAARMRQVIAITDNYVYWPLVRQAFSHGVYRPMMGEAADTEALKAGLEAAPRVLDALEDIAQEGLVLQPGQFSLADCHLWPMMDYFAMLPKARELLVQRDGLRTWMHGMERHPAAIATRPDLSSLSEEKHR